MGPLTTAGPPGGSATPAQSGQSLQCEKAATRRQSRDKRLHHAASCLATVTHRAPSLHPQGFQVISGLTDGCNKEWPQESQNCLSLSRENLKWSRDPKTSTTLASRGLGYRPCSLQCQGSGKDYSFTFALCSSTAIQ